jgi:hypothetical protein
MNYVHKMINSDKLAHLFDLPHNLRGCKVEVIILPVQKEESLHLSRGSSFGCLHKYANPLLIDQENGAWGEAVMDSYADS